MSDLSGLKITDRWPAKHPDRIQLYSLPTPNGVKASIMLEETGLPYEAHLVSFASDDQTPPEFLSLNPNHKIDAITLLEQGKHVVVRRLRPQERLPCCAPLQTPAWSCPRRWRSPWP